MLINVDRCWISFADECLLVLIDADKQIRGWADADAINDAGDSDSGDSPQSYTRRRVPWSDGFFQNHLQWRDAIGAGAT